MICHGRKEKSQERGWKIKEMEEEVQSSLTSMPTLDCKTPSKSDEKPPSITEMNRNVGLCEAMR